MSGVELAPYQIDYEGLSSLPEYSDSIFVVIDFAKESNPGRNYSVARVLKKDLELPLEQPVELSLDQLCALRIDDSGISSRSDLSGYQFKYEKIDNDKYKITKLIRSYQNQFHSL